jgi:SAM-dependent methyltransferase
MGREQSEPPKGLRVAARLLHKIPWDDPAFSERMLREHLSQAHDGASRRSETIDAQVQWIANHLLTANDSRVLDLGCGPGLYTERLAALGHQCGGIDISPASIEYARKSAAARGSTCRYACEDIRTAEYGRPHDLVMLLSGELNMFDREDARLILAKARKSLAEGGRLLLEVHPLEAVKRRGERSARRYATPFGPFSDRAHSVIEEHEWNDDERTAHTSYFVIDAATADVTVYGETTRAYSEADLSGLLSEAGLTKIKRETTFPAAQATHDLVALVAQV